MWLFVAVLSVSTMAWCIYVVGNESSDNKQAEETLAGARSCVGGSNFIGSRIEDNRKPYERQNIVMDNGSG